MVEELPAELLFHIASFLDPLDIVRLQAVSKRLFKLGRDNPLWKLLTFENSELGARRWAREKHRPNVTPTHAPVAFTLQQATTNFTHTLGAPPLNHDADPSGTASAGQTGRDDRSNERARALANWDPSYPTERVDWYSEYIARYAPLSMNWLQHPTADGDRGGGGEKREVQGMALFDGRDAGGRNMVVAPLDDGSVCIWDISAPHSTTRSRQGRIVARSKPGLLTVDGANNSSSRQDAAAYHRAKTTSTGVVECVSVDRFRQTAYFAVQSALNEVDLSTLQLVSHHHYPFPISALSETQHPLPLTVGTTSSLHLHDPRQPHNSRTPHHPSDTLDPVATFPTSSSLTSSSLQHRLHTTSPPAPLFRPGPLSILHLDPLACSNPSIFVAGRFPSILHYSRRLFPRLHNTIHSGARLCALTSYPFPFPFSPPDHNLSPLSTTTGPGPGTGTGTTLVAAGEYNGKGSLELYGLRPPTSDAPGVSNDVPSSSSSFKNRVTASSSKLLSVAPHGTRVVYADGGGALKWVERDGETVVRSWDINLNASGSGSGSGSRGAGSRPGLWSVRGRRRGLFGSSFSADGDGDGDGGGGGGGGGGGDVARKILTTGAGSGAGESEGGARREGLLVWTGERVGMVGYGETSELRGAAEEWEERLDDGEVGKEERMYGITMRRALERQADEVRFVRGLGLGR